VGRAGDRSGGIHRRGDQVLVTVYYSARGRGSGIEYEERLFDVYTFSDGQCVHKREFRERSEAVEAAGLD